MSISKEIRAYRKRVGFTRERLAAYLDVSFVTIGRWERGINKPSSMALRMLQKRGVVSK